MAKDTVRLETLRGMSAAFTNELVAKNRKPNEILGDEEVLVVIARLAKQRKDSIEQFTKGGRNDLVDSETAELKILETYLPQMMSEEEVMIVAKTKLAEMGEMDKSKMGMFMGTLMKELKGKADGNIVKLVVEKLLT